MEPCHKNEYKITDSIIINTTGVALLQGHSLCIALHKKFTQLLERCAWFSGEKRLLLYYTRSCGKKI